MTLSSQLLWNYWSDFHETWYVDRTSYGVMHIGRKFWSPHFCGSYAPWNLENIRKSTNNLKFLCQIFINEITASDAGPDIIRSHLFVLLEVLYWYFNMILRLFLHLSIRVVCFTNTCLSVISKFQVTSLIEFPSYLTNKWDLMMSGPASLAVI